MPTTTRATRVGSPSLTCLTSCPMGVSPRMSWPSETFTLKCCLGSGMVCHQSQSWYLMACQDQKVLAQTLLFVLFVSSCFRSVAWVSKIQTPKSKIDPRITNKQKNWNGCISLMSTGERDVSKKRILLPFLCFLSGSIFPPVRKGATVPVHITKWHSSLPVENDVGDHLDPWALAVTVNGGHQQQHHMFLGTFFDPTDFSTSIFCLDASHKVKTTKTNCYPP